MIICFLYLVFDLIVYRGNYYEHRYNLLYLAGANIDLFVAFILSVRFKNVSHEKAHIIKNIPLYLIFSYGIGSQVFLFYFNDNPFVNILGVFFAVTVVLCVFTVSLPFFVLIITSYLTLLPGFLSTFSWPHFPNSSRSVNFPFSSSETGTVTAIMVSGLG